MDGASTSGVAICGVIARFPANVYTVARAMPVFLADASLRRSLAVIVHLVLSRLYFIAIDELSSANEKATETLEYSFPSTSTYGYTK